MGELYSYASNHLTNIRAGTVTFTQMAQTGQVGTGSFAIDDPDGTQAIIGQKDFWATQSSCATPLLFRGYVDERQYGRDAGTERQPHVGAGRGINVNLVDTNAMLGFDAFRTTDANRPAETVAARGAWLLGTTQMTGIADNGRCSFPSTKGMDANDYRNVYPGDVLADMATAAGGYNYHVNDYGSGPELIFRDDNTQTTDSSTLRISNVLSDASSDTLHPYKDATLTRKPGRVYSVLGLQYATGTRYADRPATATAFNGTRTGIVSNSLIKTSGKADDELKSLLWTHHTEEDHIEVTVLATDAQVNLMPAGWRIQAKFSHFSQEGYDSFTWFQIVSVTKKPIVAEGELYEVTLLLSPQEEASPPTGIVQSVFGWIGEGGGTLTFPNPVTIGSTLVFCIGDRGVLDPIAPSVDTDKPHWGTDPWAKLPNNTAADGPGGVGNIGDGVAIWYKTADATSQEGYTAATNCIIGIYELANVDIGSATTVYKDQQSAALTMDIGSLGSPADGAVSIMVGLWFDDTQYDTGTGHDQPDPSYTPRTGWTLDKFDAAFHGRPILWNAPLIYIAHALGDGSALTAGGTRSALQNEDGRWGGAAITIPPA